MKKTKPLAVIAAIGLMTLAASNLQAVELILNLSGTVTTQGNSSTNKDTTTEKTTKASFNTEDVLTTIAVVDALGSLPSGTRLVYDTEEGTFSVQDKDGAVLDDATGFFTFDSGDSVFSGQFNDATGAQKFTDNYISTFTFDPGNGNSFTITGITKETFSQSAAKNGEAKVSDSISLTGDGEGTVDEEFALVSGKVSAKGKDTVPVTE